MVEGISVPTQGVWSLIRGETKHMADTLARSHRHWRAMSREDFRARIETSVPTQPGRASSFRRPSAPPRSAVLRRHHKAWTRQAEEDGVVGTNFA